MQNVDFSETIQNFIKGIGRLNSLSEYDVFAEYARLSDDIGQDFSRGQRIVAAFLDDCPRHRLLKFPDKLFAVIQYGMARSFAWKLQDRLFPKDHKVHIAQMLEATFQTVPNLTKRAVMFQESCDVVGKMTDAQLVDCAENNITVNYQNLWQPARGALFTKLNHGFWEFFFCAYSSYQDNDYVDKNIRDRRHTNRPSGTHKSGFYEALTSLIETSAWDSNEAVRFGIGIGAGQKRFDEMLHDKLTTVSRGALIGMLSFFGSIQNGFAFPFEDGAEPRDMLFNGRLPEFMENNVNTSDACLIISPSHLEGIELPSFEGVLCHLAIPRSYVHQSWRSVLPTVIGKIDKLLEQYGKITVLMQGANFSTLVAFAIEQVFSSEEKKSINFFDIGRLLDVADLEICKKRPSFGPFFDSPDLYRSVQKYLTIKK